MPKFHKLVRDKIPQIIRSENRNPITRILSDDEYIEQLYTKLIEESQELQKDKNLEEIADVLEVLLAIIKSHQSTFEDIDKLRQKKFDERGGFEDKIFLEEVII
jgi:predicted house-cleaning noncanonical NTP pyrophosphatase (MazG superfamily)